jgi:phosphatidylserine decarboxylase
MVLDGILYGLSLIGLGVGAAYFGGIGWALPLWALAAFVLYFFRDPERVIPAGEGVVSPADGRVVDLRQIELDGQPYWKISIFLNIFNVHVNRAPVGGTIREQVYSPGRFLVASRPEASVQNEQNTVTIESAGETVVFKQIAGAVARRIVFRKKVGDHVERGERVGLIKFGSRVDLFLPLSLTPQISVGDRVSAGSSWIARPATVARAAHAAPSQFDRLQTAKESS